MGLEVLLGSVTKKQGGWGLILFKSYVTLTFLYFVLFDRVLFFPFDIIYITDVQTSTIVSQFCILTYSLLDAFKKSYCKKSYHYAFFWQTRRTLSFIFSWLWMIAKFLKRFFRKSERKFELITNVILFHHERRKS